MSFPSKIVLASGNAGKVKEFNTLLANQQAEVVPQKLLGVEEVPETGTTFIENAIIKARHAAKVTGLPAIADDSGLVVRALGGAPGIYSSRFSGDNATDQSNIDLLLQRLADEADRSAHFFCMLVFMRHADDPVPLISQGFWHGDITHDVQGDITHDVQGDGGFGYDPVFYVPDQGCTAAQLEKDVKNKLSHRGQAMQGLLAQMRQIFA